MSSTAGKGASDELNKYRPKRRSSSGSSGPDSENELGGRGQGDSAESPMRPFNFSKSRILSIREESNGGAKEEMDHERMVTAAQVVSAGFYRFRVEEAPNVVTTARISAAEEPTSTLSTAVIPSPIRMTGSQKQCYSPSTGQVFQPNTSFSLSASPTPSPNRKRYLSALCQSPIAVHPLKRRGADCRDEEAPIGATPSKRPCTPFNNSISPLVRNSRPLYD